MNLVDWLTFILVVNSNMCILKINIPLYLLQICVCVCILLYVSVRIHDTLLMYRLTCTADVICDSERTEKHIKAYFFGLRGIRIVHIPILLNT